MYHIASQSCVDAAHTVELAEHTSALPQDDEHLSAATHTQPTCVDAGHTPVLPQDGDDHLSAAAHTVPKDDQHHQAARGRKTYSLLPILALEIAALPTALEIATLPTTNGSTTHQRASTLRQLIPHAPVSQQLIRHAPVSQAAHTAYFGFTSTHAACFGSTAARATCFGSTATHDHATRCRVYST